jgi:hypothetical protein
MGCWAYAEQGRGVRRSAVGDVNKGFRPARRVLLHAYAAERTAGQRLSCRQLPTGNGGPLGCERQRHELWIKRHAVCSEEQAAWWLTRVARRVWKGSGQQATHGPFQRATLPCPRHPSMQPCLSPCIASRQTCATARQRGRRTCPLGPGAPQRRRQGSDHPWSRHAEPRLLWHDQPSTTARIAAHEAAPAKRALILYSKPNCPLCEGVQVRHSTPRLRGPGKARRLPVSAPCAAPC